MSKEDVIPRSWLILFAAFIVALIVTISLAGCAGRPLEFGGSWGPSVHGKLGAVPPKEVTATEPPPGVAIIAAGEGVSINANVQVGTMQSVSSTVTNQTPISFLDKVFGGGGPPKIEDPPAPVK